MLYKPSTNLKSKRGYFGIATTRGPSGPVMRRLSFPVQSGSSAQVNWRHIFVNTKQNWQALGPGGTGYIPVMGVEPQTAWDLANTDYAGILLAGLVGNGVQAMGSLIGCTDGEAYYQMCQTNRASLGLPDLPTPALVDEYMSFPTATWSATMGNFAALVTGPPTPSPTDPTLHLSLTLTTTTQTDPPSALTAAGAALDADVGTLTQSQAPGPVFSNLPCNVTANGSYWIFDFGLSVDFNNLLGNLLTVTGFAHSAFNVTNALIYSNTQTTVSIANATIPASIDTGGSGTATDTSTSQWTATIDVTPTASTTAGTTTLTFQFTDDAGTHTNYFDATATAGNPTIATPAPTFAYPNGLGAATIYDLTYNVIGFLLTYTWFGSLIYPTSRDSLALPGIWQVKASPAYTSGYSPPAASTWSPILYTGPNLPNPADVLAAWIKANGALPSTGSIKFQLAYIDPETGSSGPALSATAGWQTGTLKGFDRSAWSGPLFNKTGTYADFAVTAPGSTPVTVSFYGSNGYGGTITLSVKSNTSINTGTPHTTKALPAGLSYDISPTTLTIPPGSITPVSATVTFTAVSGAQQFAGPIKVEATDGISTTSISFQLTVNGDVVAQPPPNYLSIDPGFSNPSIPSPSATALTFTLNNTGPNDFPVSMLASVGNTNIALEFGSFAAAAATATDSSITYAISTGSADDDLVGQSLTAAGYSPDGYNVTDATIIANDATSITIAITANPGAMTTEGIAGLPSTDLNVPAGSVGTPGTATVQMLLTVPGGIDTAGVQIQVQAESGKNSAYAGVTLS